MICGMTMAPRPTEPEIHSRCLESVRAAGFRPTIFAEPGEYAITLDCRKNVTKYGEWHNFIRCLRAVLSASSCDRLMTMQDDCIWVQHAAEFLSSVAWPGSQCGVLLAYTSRKYASYPHGIVQLTRPHARNMAGACGVVYSRPAAECLLNHAATIGWRGHTRDTITDPVKMEGVDTFIGEVLTDAGFEIWCCNPSLAQTIAKDSTLGHGGPHGSRTAANWGGEDQSAYEMFPCATTAN